MVRLKNNTKESCKKGFCVVIDTSDKNAFVYAPADSSTIIGIISETVPYRSQCDIITSGEASVYVNSNVKKGDIIRARKGTDNIPAGSCKVAQTTDTPFFWIGTALEAGKGLVRCQLTMSGGSASSGYVPYVGAIKEVNLGDHLITADTGHFTGMSTETPAGQGLTLFVMMGTGVIYSYDWTTSTSKPMAIVANTLTIATDTIFTGAITENITEVAGASYDIVSSDYYIKCDSAVDMIVNLPEATSSGRVLKIKNVNTTGKIVTVTPLGAEKIDGESTQVVSDDECIELIDDDINGWSIT